MASMKNRHKTLQVCTHTDQANYGSCHLLIWFTLRTMLLGCFIFVLPLMEIAGSSRVGQISHMATSTGEETFWISYRVTFE